MLGLVTPFQPGREGEGELKMLCSVRPTCSGFEIAFISKGLFFIEERNGRFDIPWCIFGGVGDVPGVVRCQAFLQIMRYACVVMLAGGDVSENADVVERALGGSIVNVAGECK